MKYKVHTTHVVERDYMIEFDLPKGADESLIDRMVSQMAKDGGLQNHLKEVSEEVVSKEVIRKVESWPGAKQVHPRVRKPRATVVKNQVSIDEAIGVEPAPDLTTVEDE